MGSEKFSNYKNGKFTGILIIGPICRFFFDNNRQQGGYTVVLERQPYDQRQGEIYTGGA